MIHPLQITFHEVPSSDAVEARIREHAAKLDRLFERITSCRVAVEAPHRSHQQGHRFHVVIEMHVPGDQLVVARDPEKNRNHEDVFACIDDAFKDAERLLTDYVRRRRGDVKHKVEDIRRVVPEMK
jgi:putative sigma-54 modulation protein